MKPNLIFFPQYPTKNRYSEVWFEEFPKKLSKYFNVITMRPPILNEFERGDVRTFNPIETSLRFELDQIRHYYDTNINDDDILFFSDLSFQETSLSQLYFKRPKNVFSFCHGTSKNKYDLFQKDRKSKWKCETAHAELCNKIFVSTEYHKNKLGWDNIQVIGLPRNPFITPHYYPMRFFNIVSVARPCIQKINKKIENKINEIYPITGRMCNSWDDYSKFLSSSKALIISSKEDTFNYTIIDSLQCGCIPVAPRDLCFPEILPDFLLYDNADQAIEILDNIMNGDIILPMIRLKNEELIENFYENLAHEILGNLR